MLVFPLNKLYKVILNHSNLHFNLFSRNDWKRLTQQKEPVQAVFLNRLFLLLSIVCATPWSKSASFTKTVQPQPKRAAFQKTVQPLPVCATSTKTVQPQPKRTTFQKTVQPLSVRATSQLNRAASTHSNRSALLGFIRAAFNAG